MTIRVPVLFSLVSLVFGLTARGTERLRTCRPVSSRPGACSDTLIKAVPSKSGKRRFARLLGADGPQCSHERKGPVLQNHQGSAVLLSKRAQVGPSKPHRRPSYRYSPPH